MDIDLQKLIDAAQNAQGADGAAPTDEDRKTAIREAIGDADRETVEAIQNEAIDKFNALNATDPTDEEGLATLEALTELVVVTRDVQGEFDRAEAEAAEKRAKLAAEVEAAKGEATDADADAGTEAEETADADTDGEPQAETETETDAAPEAVDVQDTPAEVVEQAAEPVLASGKRRPRIDLGAIAARTPNPKPQTESEDTGVQILAAANVRDFSRGQRMSMEELVAAAQQAVDAMPRDAAMGAYFKSDVAKLRTEWPEALVASGRNDADVIARAVDQSRLKGGSLVAAGGWCAPSETLYELAPLLADGNAGLVDLPEIQVKRGGIRTTEGADYASIYSGGQVGVAETETEAIANAEDDEYQKVIYRVPCTEFVEKRAGVVYTGVEAGILQDNAYPELTRQHVEAVVAAHAHRINELTLAQMESASTSVNLTGQVGPSATAAALNGLELLIVNLRYRYRAPESLTLEVVLPIWLKFHVRSDLALRSGVDFQQVTDAQIDGWFTARGARVQWVYDWQDAFSGVTGGFGSATAPGFATSVKALVYPAGTFVRGRGEVVSLGVTYDSVNIRRNDKLEMFNEEKLLVHKRAYTSLAVTIPLAVNGTASAPVELGHGGVITVSGGDSGGSGEGGTGGEGGE